MTVACRVNNCPLYDNGFCCDESILIMQDGRCFNLIRGFSSDDEKKLREESIMHIEDIEIEVDQTNDEEAGEDDNTRCDEGTGTDEQVQ